MLVSKFSLSRRSFLAATAAAAVSSRASAIEPFDRPQPGPLKLSLAGYSFRKELSPPKGGGEPEMDYFRLVDFCREQRLPGIELTSYYFPDYAPDRGADPDYLRSLALHCQRAGVSISGGAIRNDFCVPADRRDAEIDAVKAWVDAYATLGAPVIRVFAGKIPKGATAEQAIANCIEATQIACDYAATKGVMLALENHGGITAEADDLLAIVRGVQSPAFGVNFDSGNFRTADPYGDLAKIAPYAVNAQIKVKIGPRDAPEETDFARVVGILKDAGYGGWVALEYEEGGDTKARVVEYLDTLRPLLA